MKFLILILFTSFSYHFGVCAVNAKIQKQIGFASGDSVKLVKSIQSFLYWYKDSYIKLYEYRLTKVDASGNYQVDIKACDQYLATLKSTGYISSEYVRLWKQYFDSQVEKFKMNPQNEGPPEGFDLDLVLHTQEPEEVLNYINKLKYRVKELNKTMALVEVDTIWPNWTYNFELTKKNNKWYIDYISLKEPE